MVILSMDARNTANVQKESKMKYTIKSIKFSEAIESTISEAIKIAKKMDAEFAPAFGIQIEDEDGDEVWTSEV